MQDTPEPRIQSLQEVRSRLHDAAQLLREPKAIDPDVRRALADLMDELGQALNAPDVPPTEVARLADCAAHLAEALHHDHDRGLLERARDRLQELVLQTEARAPTSVHLVERLIDALANIGI